MAFLTRKQAPSQKESMLATLVLAAIMTPGLIYAVTSPVDWIVRLMIGTSMALYIFGVVAVLVFQKKHAESAYDLFRVTVPPGVAMAVLALAIYGIAMHPHALLPLLK
jgi:hypothetical protein